METSNWDVTEGGPDNAAIGSSLPRAMGNEYHFFWCVHQSQIKLKNKWAVLSTFKYTLENIPLLHFLLGNQVDSACARE